MQFEVRLAAAFPRFKTKRHITDRRPGEAYMEHRACLGQIYAAWMRSQITGCVQRGDILPDFVRLARADHERAVAAAAADVERTKRDLDVCVANGKASR